MRLLYGFIAALMLAGFSAAGQDAAVEAKLDTSRLLIGDQVALHFTFTGPAGAQVLWPRLPDTIYNNIQVIERGNPDTTLSQDKRTATIHQRVVLTSFDTGFYSIPPIPFYYRVLPDTATRVAETRMLLLEVSTVPVDTTRAIKPIKGPIRVPLSFRDILPWLLLVLGLAALIALVIWYLKRRKKDAPLFNLIPTVVLKPHEIALASLGELRQKKIWQAGRFKEYHSELTDILRKYIEERFTVRALESTTDEIVEGLAENGGVRKENLDQLRRILVLADLVKFAKARPVGGENEESLSLGIQFVNETIPAAQPAAPEPENK
jgi:LPXTG-motif cell wall-anchored protein